jgi:hypothetical protein
MVTVPVRPAEMVDDSVLADVGHAFTHCHTLADLLRWCATQSPHVQVSEIIAQDEYTHDVVLPFGSHFLSFDTT